MQIIPLSAIPAQTLNVVLSGRYCTVSVYWRQERLYLDLSADGVEVCRGAICQNRADVLQSRSPAFAGTLHFMDMEGDRPPHWQGLRSGNTGRWLFLHVEEGERLPDGLRY